MGRGRATWLAWGLFALAIAGLATVPATDHLLRQAGRPELAQLGADTVPYLLAIVVAASVGTLLAARRPGHPVGWLLLGLGLSVSASGLSDGYARYGVVARPGAVPGAVYLAIYSPATLVGALACTGFVLLLTPSGSLPSPRWRWWARVAAAAPVVFVLALTFGPMLIPPYEAVHKPLEIPALDGVMSAATNAAFAVIAANLAVGAASLVIRFRRARGVERLQLRWVAFAAALTGVAAVVVLVAAALNATAVLLAAIGACMAILPLAIGAAIARYRLYDLDRIISRTVTYSVLTVLLGGGYTAVTLGLGQFLGQRSSLVVAGATLAVAALFRPARDRVQHAVDRRFNRRRYDAAAISAAFGARLRQETDLDALTHDLLAVVEATVQPTLASMWLRPAAAGPGRAPGRA